MAKFFERSQKKFNLPILLITFNRVQPVEKLLKILQEIKPSKVYISSDGPRSDKPDDIEKIKEVRSKIDQAFIWDCTIERRYLETNLGCKYAPQSAITWFFENEEMGIILEDDCLPSHSFFDYSNALLNRYRYDLRVSGIIGTNFSGTTNTNNSYFFSRIFIGWGWATWQNRWQQHLRTLANFPLLKSNGILMENVNSDTALRHIFQYAEDSIEDRMDAWDFQFHLSSLLTNGLFIIPKKNLVYYEGFGLDATHTKSSHQNPSPSYTLEFPLKHPLSILPNKQFDNFHFKNKMGYVDSREKLSPRHIWGVIKKRVNNFA